MTYFNLYPWTITSKVNEYKRKITSTICLQVETQAIQRPDETLDLNCIGPFISIIRV